MRGLALILFSVLALSAHASLFDSFNPGAILKGYTDSPPETVLKPTQYGFLVWRKRNCTFSIV